MSLIDVFELIDCAEMQIPGGLDITRTSFGGSQDELGDFTPDAPTVVHIDPIMIHPVADGRTLAQLPEADRQTDVVRIYSKVRLFCDSTFQDFLTWSGRTWKVIKVEDYKEQGDGYVSFGSLVEATA